MIESILQRFDTVCRERGDTPCIVGDFEPWSFGRLDRASNGVAAGLVSVGIAPGDRVGLYCPNVPEFVVAYLGTLKAGGTIVPINLMLNPKEIGFILSDAGVKCLVYHQVFADRALEATALAGCVSVRARVGGEVPEGEASLDGWIAGSTAAPDLSIDPLTQTAVILYTSGTTGRPKGAMLSHHNLVSNCRSVAAALALRSGQDRLLVVLPMFHAFAATVGMLTPLLHGLSLVPLLKFDPKQVSAAIAEHGVTVFLGVPSMYGLLLRLDDAAVGQWASVRFAVAGGAAMPQAVMSAFEQRFGLPVLEGDGPTECSPVTCVNPLNGPRKVGSVGLPIPDVEMCVMDADGRALAAGGEHGEVCVRGPNVMQGYWGLEAATDESFHGDWFRTGDLGCRDADGYFYLVDRIKDLIITNGMNVYPRVIEEVLYRHPAVADAAVVGDPHPLHGEIPVAHVVLAEGADIDAAVIRDWCREHLGRHEVPRRILLRDALPRNAAGKILKRELRRQGEVERGVTQG